MKTDHWDKKTEEQFKNILENPQFEICVNEIRKNAGIPKNGFDVEDTVMEEGDEPYWEEAYIKDRESLYGGVRKILEKFKMPFSSFNLVKDYILKGPDIGTGVVQIDRSSFGCDYIIKNDRVEIYVYPGSKKEDVRNFLKNNWEYIDNSFRQKFPEFYEQKGIKKKNNRKRDEDIIMLANLEVLTRSGEFNRKKTNEFLTDHKVKDPLVGNLVEKFKKIGIYLPSVEARKKVIQKYFRKIQE